MKVFIVENSLPVLERLVEMVRDIDGTEVVGNACNFHDAVTGIMSARPDVAILDVRLADGNGSGIDVLNRVKPQLPALKAIVVSNYATHQHIEASAHAGAEYFLDKLVDLDRIAEILQRMQGEGGSA